MKNAPLVGLFEQYQTIKPEIDAAIKSTIIQSAFVGGKEVIQSRLDWTAHNFTFRQKDRVWSA